MHSNSLNWPFDISALELHSDYLPEYRTRMDYIAQWARAYFNTIPASI